MISYGNRLNLLIEFDNSTRSKLWFYRIPLLYFMICQACPHPVLFYVSFDICVCPYRCECTWHSLSLSISFSLFLFLASRTPLTTHIPFQLRSAYQQQQQERIKKYLYNMRKKALIREVIWEKFEFDNFVFLAAPFLPEKTPLTFLIKNCLKKCWKILIW